MSSLFHPLCGSDLRTLLRLFTQNGTIAPQKLPQAAITLAFTLLRSPFSTFERVAFHLSQGQRQPIESPIFIVGYWRSGTTHLHNLLSKDPQFGYISPLATGLPWDILGIVRALEPLLEQALPADRYIDNVAVTPDSPQEDSIALASMVPVSYYHGLYFPQRFADHFRRGVFFEGCSAAEIEQWQRGHVHLLEKVSIHQQGKRLLIKNPVYTGHIRKLRSIWHNAKFIHIYRNPYTVLQSTRHFFTALLSELALQAYDLQNTEQLPIDALILESYPRLMHALLEDSATLPPHHFVEVKFEDLETDPMLAIEQIYQTLELPGLEQARPQFASYLSGLASYRKNRYDFDPETIRLVETHWQTFVDRWNYAPPLARL